MANKIQAITTYCPRIKAGKTIDQDRLVQYIADRTGLNRGDVHHALDEFQDAIVFFALNGQGVKLEGLGTFTPSINLAGEITLSSRISPKINGRLTLSAFKGDITNRANIGKTTEEVIALWNQEHPDDPVA